jgi:hypothetical protein
MSTLDLHELAGRVSAPSEALTDRQARFFHAHVFHPVHHI